MSERYAVVGLGYVGLPVALAFARKNPGTIGFDIRASRIDGLRAGRDDTGEVSEADLREVDVAFTCDPEDLRAASFIVVAVPTPIDATNQPDLGPLVSASTLVGRHLSPGALVCYESTVYPGVTEEICGPILERESGLKRGRDFKLGYSPERINPGDREHTIDRIVKVVSGEDEEALERVASAYGAVIGAGVHRAPSIRVAEAAKVIENTQRDLNIALMNELAIICDRLGIATRDVLAAARTKWNFLPFSPGLVGGHCIGVDPYYLTAKAEQLGYHPEVILAGRRLNDGMGTYVAQRTVKLLVQNGIGILRARVGVLGVTFKEDVPDIRNSRVPDIIRELNEFGATVLVHDPLADPHECEEEYGIRLASWGEMSKLDAVIVAVAHQAYREMPARTLLSGLRVGGVLVDVRSMLDRDDLPPVVYWSL
jgi:UDP-N-acetyl-D-galactosamine dehydrogenase